MNLLLEEDDDILPPSSSESPKKRKVDEPSENAKQPKKSKKPVCKYGISFFPAIFFIFPGPKCFRKNKDHFKQFSHPWNGDEEEESEEEEEQEKSPIIKKDLIIKKTEESVFSLAYNSDEEKKREVTSPVKAELNKKSLSWGVVDVAIVKPTLVTTKVVYKKKEGYLCSRILHLQCHHWV